MTRKLYDENAYLDRFAAKVLSCQKTEKGYEVVLDATCFFPEGGGQAPDTGTLSGVSVTDVQMAGEEILHICDGPVPVGETVEGQILWPQRFSRMQQHSGEHILSGIVHAMTGFDNVGFHMGEDCTTVDFSGRLTDEILAAVMAKANETVQRDYPIRAWYPTEEELKSRDYRSKKALTGNVRLVEIEHTDLCACCAPHLSSTGQVGPMVILSRESFHGGTRLQLLCGKAAMDHITAVLGENRSISALLSAKSTETAAAVLRLTEELGRVKLQLSQTQKELYAALAAAYKDAGNVILFRENGDCGKLASAVAETCGGVCAVFVKAQDGFRYAMAKQGGDLQTLCRDFQRILGGKGGGRGGLVQGSVPAEKSRIEEYLEGVL